MRPLLTALCLLVALRAHALIIDDPNLGTSKMIPKAGDTVTWLVPVLNDPADATSRVPTGGPFEGEVTVTLRSARGDEALGAPVPVTRPVKLASGQSQDFAFPWTPPRNGYWRVVFELQGRDQRVTRRVAVTENDTWFVWFGAPQRFRWCNVPTTVRPGEEAWWLRRGAIPAQWKGGVCDKQLSVDEFVRNWGAADWIAIDEVGGPDATTDKFIAAWAKLRAAKPKQWIAVWYMGAHHYWRDIKDLVDLFLPEIYLNYLGNDLANFDRYFRVAREAGVMDKVIPGLGINEITDEHKRVTCSPTRADVLRQFRYLKRTAPGLRGIGFFTSDSAAPGVAEYADGLCEDYYLKPVIAFQDLAEPIKVSAPRPDGRREAAVTVHNVGGMDAEGVRLEGFWGPAREGEQSAFEAVADLRAGAEQTFTLALPPFTGARKLRFRLLADERFTLLDDHAATWVVNLRPEDRGATVAVVPAGEPDPAVFPCLEPAPSAEPVHALELAPGLKTTLATPCAVLPPRPGTEEKLVAFSLPPRRDRDRVILLKPGPRPQWRLPPASPAGAPAAPPVVPLTFTRAGTTLTVTGGFYQARLDLGADEISALGPRGGVENLFLGPWTFNVEGHEGCGAARVTELPGCLVVTVPYSSAKAAGESQYLFFAASPAIRVARSWAPRGEVKLQYAGDRCGLFQRGGTFALQAGVGAPVTHGRLHDSTDYRDLLFGYLGDVPRPDNADRMGWLDFSYGPEGCNGGLGVAVEYRWEDSGTKEYDVTRLYDAADWLEVLYQWGGEKTFRKPQKSCLWLIPHLSRDFSDEAVTPPAQALWRRLHAKQLAAVGE